MILETAARAARRRPCGAAPVTKRGVRPEGARANALTISKTDIYFHMRTISLHVSDSDYEAYKTLAARTSRPVAQLIREAMSRWLGEHPLDAPSLRDVRPVDLGPMLQPFDRSELADEMYQR